MLASTLSWETKQKSNQFLELKMKVTCSEVAIGNQNWRERALPQTGRNRGVHTLNLFLRCKWRMEFACKHEQRDSLKEQDVLDDGKVSNLG